VEEISAWYEKSNPIEREHEAEPGQTALQLYSSGTTGLPKGVELTHGNLMAGMMDAVPAAIGYHGAPDVMLNALPTYHIAGVGVALLTACKGGMSVLYPDFDPARAIAAIAEHRITHSFLVPAMIQFMLQVPGADKADYSSLKGISYGASPISEKVLIEAMRTFKCNFMQVYGLTETTGAVTALPPEDHDPEGPKKHLLRSAGKPIDGVELRVVDPATGHDCAEGEVGEVWIRTAQNMKGYWANPKATGQAFVDRWFRSGDAGYLREGYVYMHDRIKDMILSGGENIYPAEVENVLMQHPAVADGAVIGVPDEQWGEAVKACVVLKTDCAAGEKQIIDFMRERIAHYKCPKSVDFLEAIPRNPTGKILKRVLREPYWKGKDRRVN
jgi:fatty-acyl-CoA synthase